MDVDGGEALGSRKSWTGKAPSDEGDEGDEDDEEVESQALILNNV